MIKDRTTRRNGKWAKVSGKAGRWASAHGWEGHIKAAKLQVWSTRDAAIISAEYWLDDLG